MNFKDLYRILEKNRYYIFSFADAVSFYPDSSKASLKEELYRWRRKGWLRGLKRGLYELSYPKDFAVPDMYIANRLYRPSYVSLETAMSNYSVLPEVSMAVTSITTKPTREFRNEHGLFIYRTIRPDFFTGYHVEKHGAFDLLIAEPEKAFVDYLYFKAYRNKKFNLKDERLDRDVIAKFNKTKLNKYAKLYSINLKKIYAHL